MKKNFEQGINKVLTKGEVLNRLNHISRSSGGGFAYFSTELGHDGKDVGFFATRKGMAVALEDLLRSLGIRYINRGEEQLIIMPEYVDDAKRLFDRWYSNVIVEVDYRSEKVLDLLDELSKPAIERGR